MILTFVSCGHIHHTFFTTLLLGSKVKTVLINNRVSKQNVFFFIEKLPFMVIFSIYILYIFVWVPQRLCNIIVGIQSKIHVS